MDSCNLKGQAFGRLTVVGSDPVFVILKNGLRYKKWQCRCECGKEVLAYQHNLKAGRTKSCGCLQRSAGANRCRTHGQSKTRLHNLWWAMIARCRYKNHQAYKRYGGRGIKVCKRWIGKRGFQNFISDMGNRPDWYTLDRIDNDGDYCPENCRWATRSQQSRNRNDALRLTARGDTRTIFDWCELLGLNEYTVRSRLRRGNSHEEALFAPNRYKNSK